MITGKHSLARLCMVPLVALLAGHTGAAFGDAFVVPSGVTSVLQKSCVDCHSEGSGEADVELDGLAKLGVEPRLALLAKVQEQLHLGLMPPADEAQPSAREKEELVGWVTSELAKAGRDGEFRHKLERPEYGNFVNHNLLFSGEVQVEPFSPARLWRHSPYQFDRAKRTYFGVHPNPARDLGEVGELKQPFHEGDGEGINDYAALFYADSATFDTLYRNASFVVDRTLLMAFIEYDYASRGKTMDDWKADRAKVLEEQAEEVKQCQAIGHNPRYVREKHSILNARYTLPTPQVYRDIILGDGKPSRSQMEAAIRYHFERLSLPAPSQAGIDKYARLMDEGIAESGPYFGLRNALIAIMVSPKYVYRSELGLGKMLDDGRRMLAPVELAYAISFALTDAKPDAALMEAAMNGRLETRDDVKREVERLLDDDAIEKPRILRFFREFFGYHRAPEVFKDDDRFFKSYTFFNIAEGYVRDADALVLHLVKEDKDVFQRLLSTEEFFVGHGGNNDAVKAEVEAHKKFYAYFKDKPWKNWAERSKVKEQPSEEDVKFARSLHQEFKILNGQAIHDKMAMLEPFERKGITPLTYTAKRSRDAQFKGLMAYNIDDAVNWDFPVEQPFVLDKGKRAGLLTHPAWLMAHSLNATTDPVRRGKWIRERLLAGTVPDVPITVDATVPEEPHNTLRERYAVTEAKECWKCHVKMNPLGYPFEIYDDFGRWRDREKLEGLPKEGKAFQTKPVDAKGILDGTGDPSLDGEVADAMDLVHRLAKSRRVQQSFIRHAFRYWMGRNEMISDSKTLIAAEKAYMDAGGSFRAMLVSLLTSDSFLYRKPLDTTKGTS